MNILFNTQLPEKLHKWLDTVCKDEGRFKGAFIESLINAHKDKPRRTRVLSLKYGGRIRNCSMRLSEPTYEWIISTAKTDGRRKAALVRMIIEIEIEEREALK